MTSAVDATSLVNKFDGIFKGLGTIKVNAKIYINDKISPVIDPPRRIPHAVANEVKDELDRMVKIGVIVPQNEPTPWVNSITVVRKPEQNLQLFRSNKA